MSWAEQLASSALSGAGAAISKIPGLGSAATGGGTPIPGGGFVAPGTGGTPGIAGMTPALSAAGINPADVVGVNTDPVGGGGAATPTMSPSWAGSGQVGQMYLNYVNQRRLTKLQQRTAYAPSHTTPGSTSPQFNLMQPTPPQVPAY